MVRRRPLALSVLLIAAAVVLPGCRDVRPPAAPPPTASQPHSAPAASPTPEPTATADAGQGIRATVDAAGRVTIDVPARWAGRVADHPAGWLQIGALNKEGLPAGVDGVLAAGGRLEVRTRNVQDLTVRLDDPSLGRDAVARRPLTLDQQVFEITGQRTTPLRFRRSPTTSRWEQVRDPTPAPTP